MAEVSRPSSVPGTHRQPSRLQRRAPASLQISPVSDWNVAIPLLSPLVSPSSPKALDRTVDNKSRDDHHQRLRQSSEPEKPIVFKKWQHPAAPFCYDSTPLVRPFVPV
ncbi:uncharacterized protein At4g14450, chloroplastic-like [Humulus lupulus]|uniref:uncharacterized protein At4g14450, chloroplastic-like n=1 Tax=Humulus lupulus TaxID=3486 RepID=UPI002B409364|nr:uncharacterized protein At4g14450, chloroplastic-like [Humulus lupulus]